MVKSTKIIQGTMRLNEDQVLSELSQSVGLGKIDTLEFNTLNTSENYI